MKQEVLGIFEVMASIFYQQFVVLAWSLIYNR